MQDGGSGNTLATLLAMATLLTAAALGASGCSASRPTKGAGEAAAAGGVFERRIDPFPVLDGAGTSLQFPFLGGLNVPRPQFVDIDADGDLDLFLQEEAGKVMFFEHTGTSAERPLVWRTDHYGGIDVGEWFRFVDLDGDQDLDLLAEQRYSYIKAYRNVGTSEAPRYELVVDTLVDASGQPIFADRQNIPAILDVDCDGRLDLFIGRVEGTLMRYESQGRDADGLPRFEKLTERFQDIEIVAQIGTAHGANSVSFGDIDSDGDLDLLWGDFFEPGLLLIENAGTCERPSMRGQPQPFPLGDPLSTSGYNAPVIADWQGDGDLDVFVGVLGGAFNPNRTAADNFYLLRRDGADYTLAATRFIDGIDVGGESLPTLTDVDADGDLDLLVSNKIEPGNSDASRLYLFTNTGSPTAPAFALRDTLALLDAYHYAPAFGDLDADGDDDLLLGTWNQGIAYYRNDGTAEAASYTDLGAGYITLPRGSNTTPALADLDADGDLDLLVGETSGTLNLYRNTGTATAPVFTLETERFLDVDLGRRTVPTFADLDADGDFDLLVGTEADGLYRYRNEGTPRAPSFVADTTWNLSVPAFAAPAVGDLDGDDDLDLVVGGLGGGVLYFEHQR